MKPSRSVSLTVCLGPEAYDGLGDLQYIVYMYTYTYI